jgi:hypothetical protein
VYSLLFTGHTIPPGRHHLNPKKAQFDVCVPKKGATFQHIPFMGCSLPIRKYSHGASITATSRAATHTTQQHTTKHIDGMSLLSATRVTSCGNENTLIFLDDFILKFLFDYYLSGSDFPSLCCVSRRCYEESTCSNLLWRAKIHFEFPKGKYHNNLL